MISKGYYNGSGAFKVACNTIVQLNLISLYPEYRIITSFFYGERKSYFQRFVLSSHIGWLPIVVSKIDENCCKQTLVSLP